MNERHARLIDEIQDLMSQYEKAMEPGRGAYISVVFSSSSFEHGYFRFATEWKRFIGELEFSTCAEAVRVLRDKIQNIEELKNI